jgi:hypothetical protein
MVQIEIICLQVIKMRTDDHLYYLVMSLKRAYSLALSSLRIQHKAKRLELLSAILLLPQGFERCAMSVSTCCV